MRSARTTPRKDPSRPGEWEWRFDSVHPRPDGSRRQIHRRGFPTRAAAQRALDEARQADRVGGGPAGPVTVDAVFADFIRAKRLQGRAPNTVAQYEWAAERARARWGGWPAEQLTAELLEAAYEEMTAGGRRQYRRAKVGGGTAETDQGLSARSVRAFHTALKAAYALAVARGTVRGNPALLASPPAATDPKREWWTPDQVAHLLRSVESDPLLVTGLADALVDSGGRRGEVLGLRWDDVDLVAGTALIRQQLAADPRTKALEVRPTKRPRSKAQIALHPATVEVLRRRKAEQAQDRLKMGGGWPADGTLAAGLVFTWADGRPVHPDVLTRAVQRRAQQLGLPRIGAHGLRHSFASAALAARVPVEVVAARLGNTARMVQEVYAHVIPADDAEAARVVGDLFRRAAE